MTKPLPLGLTEQAITKFYVRDPVTGSPVKDATLDRLAQTLLAARGAGEALLAVVEANQLDPTLAPGSRDLNIRRAAGPVGVRIAEKLDEARAVAVATLAELDRKMTPPSPATAHHAQLLAEIRAGLSRMSDKDRGAAIHAAIVGHDAHVCAAIFGAGIPAWLTGCSASELAGRAAMWRKTTFPHEYDRADRLRRALAVFEGAASSFVGLVESAVTAGELPERAVERTATATAAAAAE